jgi:hypothetical protein
MIEHEIFISHQNDKIKKILIADTNYAYNGVSIIGANKIDRKKVLITREYNFSSPISKDFFLDIKNKNFFDLIKNDFIEFVKIYNLEHWMI